MFSFELDEIPAFAGMTIFWEGGRVRSGIGGASIISFEFLVFSFELEEIPAGQE